MVTVPLDCRILWLTLGALVTRRGISQPGHSTAEEFTGQEFKGQRAS